MTTKINIEINEDANKPIQKATYGVRIAEFTIKINNAKMLTNYKCPIAIGNNIVSKEQIIADIVCTSIANSLYCSVLNDFESFEDYKNLADAFGYDKIEDVTRVAKELKMFSKALKSLTLNEKDREFIKDYLDIEDSLKQAAIIVNRYFNVSFVSKHYANA